jgi:hypothetical protein
MVAHTSNPRTLETEAGGSSVPSQPVSKIQKEEGLGVWFMKHNTCLEIIKSQYHQKKKKRERERNSPAM